MVDRETIDELKEIFVTRQECDQKNTEITTAMGEIKTRLAVVETLIERSNKLQLIILTSVIGAIVTIIAACIVFAIRSGAV